MKSSIKIAISTLLGVWLVASNETLAQSSQALDWNMQQINNETRNNIVFDQPSISIPKNANPIIIAPQNTASQAIMQNPVSIAHSNSDNIGPIQSPSYPKEVTLKQPIGKDACDNENTKAKIKLCKDMLEKRAKDFEKPFALEVELQNQDLEPSHRNQENLSRDPNITAQKIVSGNELESIAAGSIAKTFIENSKTPPPTSNEDAKPENSYELPPNILNAIANGPKG